jgi:hypothetical protein
MKANIQSNKVNNQFPMPTLGRFFSWFVIFVFVLTSLRGWVVLNLNMPTELVYGFSSILVILLSLYGFNCRLRIKNTHLTSLRNLMLINVLFGCYYVMGTKLLGAVVDFSVLYMYLLPYMIFLFLRTSPDKIHIGFFLIFIGISFSVIDNFRISLSGADGLMYLEDYNRKLRPLIFEAMSRTGNYLRVGGYTGSYHDSANVLGMLGSYYYVKSIIDKRIFFMVIATIALVAMMFTQSAANIIIALTTCLIFTTYIAIKKPFIGIWLLLLTFAIVMTLIVSIFPETLIFTNRIGEDGDWEGMTNKLGLEMLVSSSFWLGFGYSTGSEFIGTEVAFLKGIIELGVIPAGLLYWILIYPAYIFLSEKSPAFQALPYLAAIVFGFLSLAHYGSLFRVTNIAIFYAMYALFFMNIIVFKDAVSQKHES